MSVATQPLVRSGSAQTSKRLGQVALRSSPPTTLLRFATFWNETESFDALIFLFLPMTILLKSAVAHLPPPRFDRESLLAATVATILDICLAVREGEPRQGLNFEAEAAGSWL